MEEKNEIIPINSTSSIEEVKNLLEKIFEEDFKFYNSGEPFHESFSFKYDVLRPKKDIVSRFKSLTLEKKYSKESFKKFFLENK